MWEHLTVSEGEKRERGGEGQDRPLMVAYQKLNRSAPAGHSSCDQRKQTLQVN